MLKFKFPLIIAAVAFALSFIIGLISGVRFSSIIIRSIVLSLISGSFTFGAREILYKYVPDLFQTIKSTERPIDNTTGKNLNISIDDPIEVEPLNEEDTTNPKTESTAEKLTESDDLTKNEQTESSTNFAENIEDEEIPKDETYKNFSSIGQETMEGSSSELEELPDLQDFVPSNSETLNEQDSDFTEAGTSRFDISTDLAGSDTDTNTMVQAIRTILKREP